MPQTETLNVALVGYGYVGQTFHSPLIVATPGFRLHTVVSSAPAKVLADHPDVRVIAELGQALEDPAVDLVVIATPNALQRPRGPRRRPRAVGRWTTDTACAAAAGRAAAAHRPARAAD